MVVGRSLPSSIEPAAKLVVMICKFIIALLMKLGDLPVLSIHAFRDIVGCDLLEACDLDVLRWDFAEEGKLAMIESSKVQRS